MAETPEGQSHTEVDVESLEWHNQFEDSKELSTGSDDAKGAQVQEKPVTEVAEGGAKAWLTVLGASAALFTSFGWTNCIGLFQDEYQSNQLKQYSSSTVSWITSVQCMIINSMEFVFLFFSFRIIDILILKQFSSCCLWRR